MDTGTAAFELLAEIAVAAALMLYFERHDKVPDVAPATPFIPIKQAGDVACEDIPDECICLPGRYARLASMGGAGN